MPKNTGAKRTDEQLEAREAVVDAFELIEDAVEEIDKNFENMHVKDKTKMGVAVVLYSLDKSEVSLNYRAGSALVLNGFIKKNQLRNDRVLDGI